METNSTFNRGHSIAVAVVLSVEMILALIANGIVLLITITQRKFWKQSSTIFFTSLILAHLVMALLYMPFNVIALAAGEWIFGSTDEEKRGTCYFLLFIFWYTATSYINDTCCYIIWSVSLYCQTTSSQAVHETLGSTDPHHWYLDIVCCNESLFRNFGFNLQFSLDFCAHKPQDSIGIFAYADPLGLVIIVGIIFVTSVWTFCFTCRFINNQSVTAGESVYASRKKRLFGIFGSMLIVYIICFIPGFLYFIFLLFIEVPLEGNAVTTICFLFITIANPVVQAYFRPEIKSVLLSHCPLLSACVCCSCSHAISNNNELVVTTNINSI